MTTVDEARAALLVAFVGNATDGPIALALGPRIDALIAAIRAEGLDVERAKEAAFAIDRNGWSDEYAAKFAAEYARLAEAER